MTKNDIILLLYKLDVVKMYGAKYLKKFPKSQHNDLINEVWLNICEIPEYTFVNLYEQGEKNLTAYIKRFVENQLSPTGKTRNLQKILNGEILVNFNPNITVDNDDDIIEYTQNKRFYVETDVDGKLNEYEKRNNNNTTK